jgi:hypothetical protein
MPGIAGEPFEHRVEIEDLLGLGIEEQEGIAGLVEEGLSKIGGEGGPHSYNGSIKASRESVVGKRLQDMLWSRQDGRKMGRSGGDGGRQVAQNAGVPVDRIGRRR